MGGRGPVEAGIETYDAGSESTDKACLGRILRSLGAGYNIVQISNS